MITKAKLLERLRVEDERMGFLPDFQRLIDWAESLPDDVPQADFVVAHELEAALFDVEDRSCPGAYPGDSASYEDGWHDGIQWARNWAKENKVPLNQNHAGSNEPGFGPKTAKDLSQEGGYDPVYARLAALARVTSTARVPNSYAAVMGIPCQPEPSVLEVALRLIESGKCPAIPKQARDMAFNLIETVRAEEARRAGK